MRVPLEISLESIRASCDRHDAYVHPISRDSTPTKLTPFTLPRRLEHLNNYTRAIHSKHGSSPFMDEKNRNINRAPISRE